MRDLPPPWITKTQYSIFFFSSKTTMDKFHVTGLNCHCEAVAHWTETELKHWTETEPIVVTVSVPCHAVCGGVPSCSVCQCFALTMEYKFPNKIRRIRTSRLNTLRCVHLKPIYVIISYGSVLGFIYSTNIKSGYFAVCSTFTRKNPRRTSKYASNFFSLQVFASNRNNRIF